MTVSVAPVLAPETGDSLTDSRTPKKKTAVIHFTKAVIDGLPLPESGRVYYRDKLMRELVICVYSTGRKVFFLYKRIGLKPVRYGLGNYPDMPPQVARQEAMKKLADIASGRNPQAERRQARIESANAKSLQEVWERYRDGHLKRNCAANSERNTGYFFAPLPFKQKKLADITGTEVAALHQKIGENSPIMANGVVTLLRTLYNFATADMEYTGPHPVKIRHAKRGDRRRMSGIVLFPKKARKRFLQRDELPKFFTALMADEDGDFRDLILLLLFTAARRGNVQAMAWADVSLERGLWEIPLTKNGDAVTVSLSPAAADVLKQRLANRESESPWVFPSVRAKSGHVEEPKKQWTALIKRAELADFHMHDLRRTLATYQRSTGASLEIIGAALGHRSRQATEIYARIDMEPVRASVNAATDTLTELGKYELAKPKLLQAGEAATKIPA